MQNTKFHILCGKHFSADLKNLNRTKDNIIKQRRQGFLKWIYYKDMTEYDFLK